MVKNLLDYRFPQPETRLQFSHQAMPSGTIDGKGLIIRGERKCWSSQLKISLGTASLK